MYTTVTIQNLLEFKRNLSNYKLCYIDKISEFISEWNSDEKIFYDYKNPDYIEGIQEYYAYFTPLDINEQWGDDWDDMPYEHNSGLPYDHGDNYLDKIELIIVPFCLREYSSSITVKFPDSYGNGNSPFSVEDINLKAVPWVFIKDKKESDSIFSGCSPIDFCNIIKKWNTVYEK